MKVRTNSVLLGQNGDQGRVIDGDGQSLIATALKAAPWVQAEGFIVMGQQGTVASGEWPPWYTLTSWERFTEELV